MPRKYRRCTICHAPLLTHKESRVTACALCDEIKLWPNTDGSKKWSPAWRTTT